MSDEEIEIDDIKIIRLPDTQNQQELVDNLSNPITEFEGARIRELCESILSQNIAVMKGFFDGKPRCILCVSEIKGESVLLYPKAIILEREDEELLQGPDGKYFEKPEKTGED